MAEQNIESIDFDDEIVLRCRSAQREWSEAAAKQDLRTLDDWIRNKLDAAADSELRES